MPDCHRWLPDKCRCFRINIISGIPAFTNGSQDLLVMKKYITEVNKFFLRAVYLYTLLDNLLTLYKNSRAAGWRHTISRQQNRGCVIFLTANYSFLFLCYIWKPAFLAPHMKTFFHCSFLYFCLHEEHELTDVLYIWGQEFLILVTLKAFLQETC